MNDTSTMTQSSPPRKRSWLKWVLLGAVVLVALAAVGIWWFLRDDAPAAVNLDAAVGAVQTTVKTTAADSAVTAPAASSSGVPSSAGAPTSSGVAGAWAVDPNVGEFSFEDSTGTFVGFRVAEELTGLGSTTAVGRTPAVTGTMTIDGTTLTAASIVADMTQLTTNDTRRDGPARRALGTSQFPTATFKLTAPVELGDAAATGAKTSVTATGDLTIKGVTKSVQFPLQAQLTGDTIVVVGSLDVAFSDYGVTPPTSRIVVSVQNHGPIELQLFVTRT
ncbi:MAG TPA: YceI family protein [Ilumatobacteraceae bacterium]